MPVPTFRSSKTLDIVKGLKLSEDRLDYNAPVPAAATKTDYIPGKVGRRNSDGEVVLGLSTGNRVSLFLMGFANEDPDIYYNGGDPSTDRGASTSIGPGGRGGMPCMSGMANAEFRSTAYVSSGSWVIDDYVTSDNGDGRLKRLAAAWDSAPVCGIVSRGFTNNMDQFPGLTFWAFHHPAAT